MQNAKDSWQERQLRWKILCLHTESFVSRINVLTKKQDLLERRVTGYRMINKILPN